MITQEKDRNNTERNPQSMLQRTRNLEIHRHGRNTPRWQRDNCQSSTRANRCPRWLDRNILPSCNEKSEESFSADMLFIRNVVETSIKVTSGNNTFDTKQADRLDVSTSQHRGDSKQTWTLEDLPGTLSRAFVDRFDDEFSTSLNPLQGRLRDTQAHSEYQEVNTRSPAAAEKNENKFVLFSAAADYGFAHEVARLRRSQEESHRRLLMQCIVDH